MGPALGPLALALFNAGAPLGLVNALVGVGLPGALLGGVARVALGVGASLLANKLLAPKPKPTESQVETNQPIPPRSFHYGRVKVSGPLAFHETRNNDLYKVVLISAREVDAYEALYLNDREVTIDGSDQVTTEPYVIAGTSRVRMRSYVGTDSQTADSILTSIFPGEWTADHRLRGIAYVVTEFEATLNVENFSKVYPGGEPQVMALIRGSKIYDPRLDSTVAGGAGTHRSNDPATWEWSDNAALCALDWLIHEEGYARPIAKIDLPSWMEMADICDEPVALAAGGTEPRYRVATTVYLTEPRKDVLRRLLEAFDGQIYRNNAGLYAVRGGRWQAPTVTIDSDLSQVLGLSMREPDGLERYNELVISHLSPELGYVEAETEPWTDPDDILASGEVRSRTFDRTQVPSASQARRLAKIQMVKDNPDWLIEAQTNFAGLNSIGEELITLDFAEMLIDGPFWLDAGPQVGADFTGVMLSLRSARSGAYDWTTAEEGESVTVPPDTSPFADVFLAEPGEPWEIAPNEYWALS